jgi:hypothetical protein
MLKVKKLQKNGKARIDKTKSLHAILEQKEPKTVKPDGVIEAIKAKIQQ